MADDEYKKIFSDNLKYYMSIHNKSQVDIINDLHVTRSAISSWCNGTRLPRMDKVQLLANYFHIERKDLIESRAEQGTKNISVKINVLGRVAAGIPIEAVEEVIDTEEISAKMACTGEFFGLKIKGDSMEPKISDGDVVIVKRQDDAEDGELVIAMVNGDDAVCKRLKKYSNSIALLSSNPAYEPLIYTAAEVRSKPVRIVGKVVELRAKF